MLLLPLNYCVCIVPYCAREASKQHSKACVVGLLTPIVRYGVQLREPMTWDGATQTMKGAGIRPDESIMTIQRAFWRFVRALIETLYTTSN